jgi:regulator of sigma E protease
MFEFLENSILVVLFFSITIFVHEMGHFLVALWCRLHIEVFSIGFPPKILAKEIKGVRWQVGLIPLGGYVALPQMDVSSHEPKASDGTALPQVEPWKKIATAIAGPAMNIIFAFLLALIVWKVGMPQDPPTTVIGEVPAGSPEARAGLMPGDEIKEINGRRIKKWNDVVYQTIISTQKELVFTVNRHGEMVDVPISSDALRENSPPEGATGKNMRGLAIKQTNDPTLLNLSLVIRPLKFKDPETGVVQGPAFKAGVKYRDKILALDGVPMTSHLDVIDYVRSNATTEKPVKMLLERKGKEVEVDVLPEMNPQSEDSLWLGVWFTAPDAYPKPHELVNDIIVSTFETLRALFQPKTTGVTPQDLQGPVGIVGTLYSTFSTDWRLGLWMVILLNVNLAVLNLMPIPVLDGGHIVLNLMQMVTRRQLPPKVINTVQYACMILLLSFILYVTRYDIQREFFPSAEPAAEEAAGEDPALQDAQGEDLPAAESAVPVPQ